MHEGVLKETIILNATCDGAGFWTWTAEGQIQWSEGREKEEEERESKDMVAGCKKCVTSLRENQPLAFTFCKPFAEDQNVEIGRFEENDGKRVLRPLGKIRQDFLCMMLNRICF